MKRSILRFLAAWIGIHVPYTREELKASGHEPIDNSDLNALLQKATKAAKGN